MNVGVRVGIGRSVGELLCREQEGVRRDDRACYGVFGGNDTLYASYVA